MANTSYKCTMEEDSDGVKEYTVSCYFSGLTREQRDRAIISIKNEKQSIDAETELQKAKECADRESKKTKTILDRVFG